jgi:RNA polymerase sigma-70 factor (ECF subfamily)
LIDQKLIEECKKGDLNAFRIVIREASPFAFSVAFRILGDQELAKDMVQETMVTIWEKLKMIKTEGSFRTWLYRIVVNKCNDHLRKRMRRPEFRPDEKTWSLISNSISEQPHIEIENAELENLINFFVQKLSPKQKTVFILSEIEEFSSDEISEITGISKPLIKANLHYARKHISELMSKYF